MSSSAMDAILAQIDRDASVRQAHQQRIDADPRIKRLRAMRAALAPASSGLAIFAQMADGTIARRHRIAALVRVRIAQLDYRGPSKAAKTNLHDAAITRRQHHVVVEASLDMVALKLITDPMVSA
jgi:hypothetical protein